MSNKLTISFSDFVAPKKDTLVLLTDKELNLSKRARSCDPQNILERAFKTQKFKGELASSIELLTPSAHDYDRLIVVGIGEVSRLDERCWLRIGGAVMARIKDCDRVSVVMNVADDLPIAADDIARFVLGLKLRAYEFVKYKTKSGVKGKSSRRRALRINILCDNATEVKKACTEYDAVGEGIVVARNLVNEPANSLGPVEFADRVKSLEKLKVKVDILTKKELKKLDMQALLGVGQGSQRPPRVAVMHYNGAPLTQKPLAFIGKGVVFDSGGISLKPSGKMEEMKGDMAGAATVVGLMHALAARKAKINVVGVIGIAENMPDGKAQRPGDIVKSMSGQTIEILNTDAEGRLLLCDILYYCNKHFKPRLMVDVATLTGSIVVALGEHYAGLFSNNDTLAKNLFNAGKTTGEKLWRLPLGDEYNKMIDSKIADVKHVSEGYAAGSITAGQFLHRFVGKTPWAHLDIAGVGNTSRSTRNEFNQSWGTGFGVRLLDRFIKDYYENR